MGGGKYDSTLLPGMREYTITCPVSVEQTKLPVSFVSVLGVGGV